MSDLTFSADSSNSSGKSIKDIFNEVFGHRDKSNVTIPRIVSLAKDRRNKVMMLRSQLAHDTYDIEERIDTILDTILTDIKS